MWSHVLRLLLWNNFCHGLLNALFKQACSLHVLLYITPFPESFYLFIIYMMSGGIILCRFGCKDKTLKKKKYYQHEETKTNNGFILLTSTVCVFLYLIKIAKSYIKPRPRACSGTSAVTLQRCKIQLLNCFSSHVNSDEGICQPMQLHGSLMCF